MKHEGGTHNLTRFFSNGNGAGNLDVPDTFLVENDVVVAFQGQTQRYRGVLNYADEDRTQREVGLNLAFDNGSPLTFKLDAAYAYASDRGTTQNITTENDAANGPGQRIDVGFDFSDFKNPVLNFLPLAAEDYALSQSISNRLNRSDKIRLFRADGSYDFGGSFLDSLDFGVRISNRKKRVADDTTSYSYASFATRPDLDSSFLETPDNVFDSVSRYFGGAGAEGFPLFNVDKISAHRFSDDDRRSAGGRRLAGRFADRGDDMGALFAINDRHRSADRQCRRPLSDQRRRY